MFANFAQVWRRTRLMPKPLLIGGGLLCAAMIGVASQHDNGGEDFFRVETLPEVRKPIVPEVIDRMLRPPPESPAQQWVTSAEKQLASRKLTTPQGDNAYDSVLAAWDADPAHAGLPPLVVGVLASLGDEMAMRLRRGDEDRAREYLQRATQFADRTAPLGTEALHGIHEKAAEALRKRVVADEKTPQPQGRPRRRRARQRVRGRPGARRHAACARREDQRSPARRRPEAARSSPARAARRRNRRCAR